MIDTAKIRKSNLNNIEKLGYNSNINLPLIENKEFKKSSEILNRIIILHILYAVYLEGSKSIDFFYNEIRKNNLQGYLSTKEKLFFKTKKISRFDLINFSWYKESIFVLLWSMKQIKDDTSVLKIEEIDMSDFYHLMPPEKDYYSFFELEIIDEYKIYELLDYYYLLHWKVKKNNDLTFIERLLKRKNENKINESVILERRKALEWIADANLDWDDISLDT